MAIPTYDWSEPEIRRLVEFHHTPDERVVINGSGGITDAQIVCDYCRTSPWPCAFIEDLRTWYVENEEARRAGRTTTRSSKT